MRPGTELKWIKYWTGDTLHRLGPTVWSLSHRLPRSQWLFKTVIEWTMLVFPSFYTWLRLVTIKVKGCVWKKSRSKISKICPTCVIFKIIPMWPKATILAQNQETDSLSWTIGYSLNVYFGTLKNTWSFVQLSFLYLWQFLLKIFWY